MEKINNNLIQNQQNLPLNKDREVWPDCLRIIAAFSVIFLHAAARGFSVKFSPASTDFQACNFYDAISRWNVPVFVMLSGMFLLDPNKEYSLKKLYSKIFRIAIACFFWAIFYSLIKECYAGGIFHIKRVIKNVIMYGGHYHLWFLFMLIGLYVATPVFRLIVKDTKVLQYFIIAGGITVICKNTLSMVPAIASDVEVFTSKFEFHLFAGFAIYYLLGYWLITQKLSKKQKMIIYLSGIASFIACIVINGWLNVRFNTTKDYVFNSLGLKTFLMTITVFVFCQEFFSGIKFSDKQKRIISELSRLSFGIYLVHAFVLEHLYCIGLPSFFIHPVFSVPISSIITFVISLAIVHCIDKIPFIRKYVI